MDKADDTGTGDVETGSTDGIGVDTAVTGETEAGAVTEGTDETGAVDEVEAVDDTEGSTDMETGVHWKTTQEQVHWNWRSPRPAYCFGPRDLAACRAGTGPKKDRPEADDRTHDKQNRTGWPAWKTRTGKSATDTDDGIASRKDITRRRVPLDTDGKSRKKQGLME